MTRRFLATAFALLCWGGALHSPCAADLKVAWVDMLKVTDGFTALQDKRKELDDWQNQKAAYLKSLGDYEWISAAALDQVITLLKKTTPLTEAEKKQLQDLTTTAAAKEQRFRELESKVDRTPAENEEFNSLGDLARASLDRITAEKDSLSSEYDKRLKDAKEGFMQQVQKVAEALAKEQGYGLVLDSAVVLTGGEDITQKVIDKLNAK